MKEIVYIIFTIIVFISCKQTIQQEVVKVEKEEAKVEKEIKIEEKQDEVVVEVERDLNYKELLNKNMIGILAIDQKEELSKKYSLDVSSACYSCDMANLTFTDKKIVLENVCESSAKISFTIDNMRQEGNICKISFKQQEELVIMSISKLEDISVYSIQLSNNFKQIDDLYIKSIYTNKETLKTFEIHDCGEFEG
ncbi:hypothetical protein [Aquimarina rhabdastrellae]